MKKSRKFAIAFLVAVLIFIGTYNVLAGLDSVYNNDNRKSIDKSDMESTLTYYTLSLAAMQDDLNNIYCLEKGQNFTGGGAKKAAKVVIDGNIATFYKFTIDRQGNGWAVGSYKKMHTTQANEANNILAAILTDGEIDGKEGFVFGNNTKYTYGHTMAKNATSELVYTDAQLGLYKYIGTWINEVKANEYGFNILPSVFNEKIEYEKKEIEWAERVVEQARKKSSQYKYSLTMYLITHGEDENGADCSMEQVVLVTYPGKPEKSEQQISVSKVWADSNNANNNRPSSVTVKLLKNNQDTGKTLTLNSNGGWKGTFTGIPGDANLMEYSVQETVPPGYNCNITGNGASGFTITNSTKTTSVKVSKSWSDDGNRDGKRPSSITVTLYENGSATNKTATLNANNGWSATFSNLPTHKNKSAVTYTVQENVLTGYSAETTGNATSGYTITNTRTTEKTNIKVSKVWDDTDNLDDLQTPITVELYANNDATGQTVTLNDGNNWTAEFTDLYKYEKGRIITYTVEETGVPEEYTSKISGDATNGFTITNTHEPHYDGYVEITGKIWLDGKDGKDNNINGICNVGEEGTKDKLLEGRIVRLKYIDDNGEHKLFNEKYSSAYETTTDDEGKYTIKVNYDNSNNVYKLYENIDIVNKKLKTAYVEFEYDGIKYTTVKNETNSSENKSVAVENEKTRLELNGKYSTIDSSTKPEEWPRTITATTKSITSYPSKNGTGEETVKYCNGKGTYQHTNIDKAWEDIKKSPTNTCPNCEGKEHTRKYNVNVTKYENINLGLFEREQPDVAIYSDLSKVEVTMNGQKYTYLYNVRSDKFKDAELKVKFQNKDTYTYRRPVNPADIAYINEPANEDKELLEVYVTYKIKVANLSSTLQTTIHNITNSYDKEYTLKTSGWTVTSKEEDLFNQAISGELNIVLEPQKEEEIELTYKVSPDAIRKLLTEEATLNNAVEIYKYSTKYGVDTLYAEQRTHEKDEADNSAKTEGRAGKLYAGYDMNSHPGNANIQLKTDENGVERLYSTDKEDNIIPVDKVEDDTDIAPSFVLCKDDTPKTLSGTIWEDVDNDTSDGKRNGDGHYNEGEKKVKNVKVELYNLDGNLATLYDSLGNTKPARVYTKDAGEYSLEGVVTGEYFIKYTYGNNIETLDAKGNKELESVTTIVDTTVNARNYKSTIITDTKVVDEKNITTFKDLFGKDYSQFSETEKMWHITHTDGYSVAVDNMKDRLAIGELTFKTYETGENMTAYTKPFKTQVEFEATGQSQVKDENGKLEFSNNLNKLDFGIAERPREDLFVEKTIKYFKITLANGQILAEGNPSNPQDKMNYTKAIGFNQEINSGEAARKALEKQLLVEVDSELIQGAQLEIQYAVKVKNNNEIDYDYEDYENKYDDIVQDITDNVCDKYITKRPAAEYYYYGTNEAGLEPLKATIEFVDYLDKDMVYKEDTTKWKLIEVTELSNAGLISQATKDAVDNNPYNVLQTASGAELTLERGAPPFEQDMTASKLLANKEDNVYDNNAEIIKIDGKTARTIKGIDSEGEEIKYIPGNYIPNMNSNISEQDDDRVKIIITPPTGVTNYTTTYIISALIGLIIISIGVIIIKKKVLTK